MKNKLISILILFAMLTPFSATYILLNIQRAVIKHDVKRKMIAGLSKEELVLLKFTREQSKKLLQWKHSKEFEYNNQMYDIVINKVKGDTIYYWCWLDNEETKLNKQLNELVSRSLDGNPEQQENTKKILTFYKSLFIQQYSKQNSIRQQEKSKIRTAYFLVYESVILAPPLPPPRIC